MAEGNPTLWSRLPTPTMIFNKDVLWSSIRQRTILTYQTYSLYPSPRHDRHRRIDWTNFAFWPTAVSSRQLSSLTCFVFLYAGLSCHTDINNARKHRRPRIKYTTAQIWHLEKFYLECPSLDANRKREIAESTGLEWRQVGGWFQNRSTVQFQL